MRSLSEIETTAKRASRAIGFSWGVSEEIAKSIRLLELFGLPGIKNINQYFEDKKVKKFENLNLITEKNLLSSDAFCPVTLGVSFLDQVRSLEKLKKIQFANVAYPIIFLSFLSRASEVIGKKIFITIDDNKILLNFNVSISSNFINEKFPKFGKNIEIEFIENQDNFTDYEWKNLYNLSENTFVEESDSLKQGAAGAGLTDND
ncbi:DUF3726 domain-containing protein [Pelagibacterales bacterium SAG-MED46]|nr:DUF3726 domain-containing protein [Pelagibacterales bacterium SAG-MED46]